MKSLKEFVEVRSLGKQAVDDSTNASSHREEEKTGLINNIIIMIN